MYILASLVLCSRMFQLVNVLHEGLCLLVVLIPLTFAIALDRKYGLLFTLKKNWQHFPWSFSLLQNVFSVAIP